MRALGVAVGLLLGVAVSAVGGCDKLCETSSSLAGSRYALDAEAQDSRRFTAAEYALTLSDDRSTVTERFRLGDKRYELTYAVTHAERH